jgi:hypothetical protein
MAIFEATYRNRMQVGRTLALNRRSGRDMPNLKGQFALWFLGWLPRREEAHGPLRRSSKPRLKAASHSSEPTTEGSSAGASGSATRSRKGRCHHPSSCHPPLL